jgi:hypothetical protein
LGKIVLETKQQIGSPSQRTTKTWLEKKVKESQLAKVIAPPQSVEGEDWVVLQPKTSLMKKIFKQKSLAKITIIGSNSRVQSGEVLSLVN